MRFLLPNKQSEIENMKGLDNKEEGKLKEEGSE